ncbi:HAD family hydrolase [Macrococcoides bohemicum]|uniref:HAD family hydrolase n=1 Tax=Macrococcoides bohemicum TaxID=1903056 RepID=A0A328A4Z8_9STAP|nr:MULTISPECIES: HAD family hydrolase [Macrococcus]ATD31103.1 hypothetical protein BHM04_07840 [Macrococcus sp. IME1552]RAK49356.1 HAD family hydrolase [Macrococcus bohemicus]
MKYKLVIFDKDGTLLRFESVWVKIGHNIVDSFINTFDVQIDKQDILQALGLGADYIEPSGILSSGTTNDIIKVFNKYVQDDNVEMWTRKNMDALANQYEHQLEMIKGTDVVLKRLKDSGYLLAVITADDYISTDNFLRKFDIRDYFNEIITSDRVPVQKPNHLILDSLIEKYQIKTSEMIMVGDTPIDMQLGKNGNIGLTIGVLSGTSKHEHLHEADIILNDVTELIKDDQLIWEEGF